MKQVLLPITVVIIGVITFIAYTTAQQAIRTQAIDGCLRSGTANFKNKEGVNVTMPDEYSYNLCMKRKGIK